MKLKWFKTGGIILLIAFVFSFFSNLFYNAFTYDDAFSLATIKAFGFKNAWFYYYQNVNGRWLSHFFLLAAFQFCSYSFLLYSLMSICLLLFSIVLIAALIKPVQESFKLMHFLQAGVYFSLLYFVLYSGKFECFFWMNSIFMHWLGLIFILACLALLKYQVKLLFTLPVFFMCGGFNEIFALTFAFILLSFSFLEKYKPIHKKIVICSIALVLGLCLNFISGGISTRLQLLPDFQFIQSVKNTLHSIFILFVGQKFSISVLLIILAVMAILVFSPKINSFNLSKPELILLAIAFVIGLFLTSFVLSDVAPYRSLILPVAIAIFTLHNSGIFGQKKEP